MNQAGSGPGAILHADYGLVSAARPAIGGETVLIYLTGMGAVNPSVPDGTAGGTNPLKRDHDLTGHVYVAGQPATVVYSGVGAGLSGPLPDERHAAGAGGLGQRTPGHSDAERVPRSGGHPRAVKLCWGHDAPPGPAGPRSDLAATAPACVTTEGCTEWVQLGGGAARSLIYRTYSLDAKNEEITRALIMVHGAGRDADNYFRTADCGGVSGGRAGQYDRHRTAVCLERRTGLPRYARAQTR